MSFPPTQGPTVNAKRRRVDGLKLRLDVTHPNGTVSEVLLRSVRVEGPRLQAALTMTGYRPQFLASVLPCACCDAPVVDALRLMGDGNVNHGANLRAVLVAESRRMVGELVYQAADEAGLLVEKKQADSETADRLRKLTNGV